MDKPNLLNQVTNHMKTRATSQDDHQARSDFIRELVQRSCVQDVTPVPFKTQTPRSIFQYWNDLEQLPVDVKECIESWRKLEEHSFELFFFDDNSAREFISRRLGLRYEKAYSRCYHPAMKSDYFRLCYIYKKGGCYIDADDVYLGSPIEHLFSDGRLKIQPLCYDVSTNEMVPPSTFTKPGANASSWIFYLNNNPLICVKQHPIIERALATATEALEVCLDGELPEIQSTTGPGNLTKSIFDLTIEKGDTDQALLVLCAWEDVATSRWPLSYRQDTRNWRLSNKQEYKGFTFYRTLRGAK